MLLVDTHAHLDFDRFADDFDDVLARAAAAGVGRMVSIGASGDFEANGRALALAARHDAIWATVGIHPHGANAMNDERLALLRAWATENPRVVAIGETGLDYFYDYAPREVQHESFRRQIRLACELGKPVVIHTRDAEEDTVAILREEGAERCGGIIHCFSGGAWLAEQALGLGFHLSFSGIVTFSSAREVREVARTAPAERILVETDAPFLAPVPNRGKRNEPAFVADTLRCVAELRGEDPIALAAETTRNAARLFGWSDWLG